MHIAEVLGLSGFLTGERFEPVPLAPDAPPSGEYLAVYEIETDDIGALLQGMGTAKLDISPALDTANVRTEVFRTITAKQSR